MLRVQAKSGILNSWKEIAAYLGRGVRTVQRWEKIGLPVCRVGAGNRSPVLAYTREIDLWVQSSQASGCNRLPSKGSLPVNNSLQESLRQARVLRNRMAVLRVGQRGSLQQLIATVLAMGKACTVKCAQIPLEAGLVERGLPVIPSMRFSATRVENGRRSTEEPLSSIRGQEYSFQTVNITPHNSTNGRLIAGGSKF
jgi:hypothetical protein